MAAITRLAIALALLGATCCLAFQANQEALGRRLLQQKFAPPSNVMGFSSSPDLKSVWTVKAAGDRNFTCAPGGKVAFFGTVCNITGEGGGTCYYTPPMPGEEAGLVGYFAIRLGPTTYWMDTLRNMTSAAPGGNAIDWAAWPVARQFGGGPACDYVTRVDTTGGVTPKACGSTPEGGTLTVPYTANYVCYACTNATSMG